MQYLLEDNIIYYHVFYGKSKKITLEISPEGLITIRAPKNTTEELIQQFILTKKKELLNYLHRIENRTYISSKKEYTEEEAYLYLGKVYRLAEILSPLPDSEELILKELKRFYSQKTKTVVKERVEYFEKLIGVKSKSITIVDSAKSWGTCNSLRELTFNYRLSMAPLPVIDSIVIHELCHLLHLNHDRSFWRKVGTYDPKYQEHHAYLDRFGLYMTV